MFKSILPPNATAPERALEEAVARISDVPVRVRDVWNPDTIPLPLLPWLAWAFSVDEWSSQWTEQQKRDTVKSSLEVQKIKGTIGAVKRALSALGINIQVQEWFQLEPQGQPYTFRVYIETADANVSLETMRKALNLIELTKSLRSHLETVYVTATSQNNVFVGTVAHIGSEITISNYRRPQIIINPLALVIGDIHSGA